LTFPDIRRNPLKPRQNPDFFFERKASEFPTADGLRVEYRPGGSIVHSVRLSVSDFSTADGIGSNQTGLLKLINDLESFIQEEISFF
jgi:hypothetical protein